MLDVKEICDQAEVILAVLKEDYLSIVTSIDTWLNLYFDDIVPKSIEYGATHIKYNADEDSISELNELVMSFIYIQTFMKRCGLTPFYEGHNYKMAYRAVDHL